MKALLGVACVLLAGSAAHAATPYDLYVQGKYDDAVTAGLAQNTASGFALAARAELASEMMREHPCMECLERAERYAQRAVEVDPKQPEGHIYLAVTMGYEARIIGTIAARFRGYAQKAKDEIDAAIAVDPRDAWAWAALGGWNIEVVRGGGKTLARWMYGATVEKGLADFQKAFSADPDNFVLRFQYALTLGAYDRDRFRTEVASALANAVSARPKTAYERFAQSRARALLTAWNAGDMATFDSLVRHDQGYP